MTPHHETIRFEHKIAAPPARVFAAYLDPAMRETWSAPSDTAAVRIEHADVRTGGLEATRCGGRDDLRYRTEVRYHLVLDDKLICFSETLFEQDEVLTAALITWELRPDGAGRTRLVLTDQVTSFVGPDAIEGHRQGFAAALNNLASHVAKAENV